MNTQNMINQLAKATNPQQMLMGMLNPNQMQLLNQFKGKNNQQQAEEIARLCNEKGISKDDLQRLMGMFNK